VAIVKVPLTAVTVPDAVSVKLKDAVPEPPATSLSSASVSSIMISMFSLLASQLRLISARTTSGRKCSAWQTSQCTVNHHAGASATEKLVHVIARRERNSRPNAPCGPSSSSSDPSRPAIPSRRRRRCMHRHEPSYQESAGDSRRARLVPMFLFVSPRLPISGECAQAEQGG
jgi:hypothetical protein